MHVLAPPCRHGVKGEFQSAGPASSLCMARVCVEDRRTAWPTGSHTGREGAGVVRPEATYLADAVWGGGPGELDLGGALPTIPGRLDHVLANLRLWGEGSSARTSAAQLSESGSAKGQATQTSYARHRRPSHVTPPPLPPWFETPSLLTAGQSLGVGSCLASRVIVWT